MRISVVIPMYNSQETIIKTLDSVRNQTAADQIIETIIVNDGSTDKSLETVQKYIEDHKDMPILLINQSNGGVSSARNAGMTAAKGDWIALLDSDDTWLPNKTEQQIGILKNHPEIDFLGGDIDDKGLKILTRRIEGLYKANVKDICIKMFPQTSVAIFKKIIFDTIGGYDVTQSYAEDGNYFLKICSRYNYYHYPAQMISYGDGKPAFGYSGLSANLKKMYEGNVKNFKELKRNSIISLPFYLFLRIFAYVKYIRRIIMTSIRIMKNSSGM